MLCKPLTKVSKTLGRAESDHFQPCPGGTEAIVWLESTIFRGNKAWMDIYPLDGFEDGAQEKR
jgi:hypothetical protein